jgi:hypothetical protein
MLSLIGSISKRAWIALGVLGSLLTLLFLPLSWKQRADMAAAWGPLIQSVDATILLVVYASLLTAWLFWIDLRPELRHRRVAKAFNAPDVGDGLKLKEEVVQFATTSLKRAFEDLAEAHRISAYTVKDSWDHPANFLVWKAFAQLQSYDGRYFLLTHNRPSMMNLNKDGAQRVTVELLKQYYKKMHDLVYVVVLLRDNKKPFTPHKFDDLLRRWLVSHMDMLQGLKRLQAMPGLEILSDFDTKAHFESKSYDASIVSDALSPIDGV